MDPATLVTTPDGRIEFGQIGPEIAQAIGREAAPIRLVYGEHRAANDGFGKVHIDAEVLMSPGRGA